MQFKVVREPQSSSLLLSKMERERERSEFCLATREKMCRIDIESTSGDTEGLINLVLLVDMGKL